MNKERVRSRRRTAGTVARWRSRRERRNLATTTAAAAARRRSRRDGETARPQKSSQSSCRPGAIPPGGRRRGSAVRCTAHLFLDVASHLRGHRQRQLVQHRLQLARPERHERLEVELLLDEDVLLAREKERCEELAQRRVRRFAAAARIATRAARALHLGGIRRARLQRDAREPRASGAGGAGVHRCRPLP